MPQSSMFYKGWKCTYRKVKPELVDKQKIQARLAKKAEKFNGCKHLLPEAGRAGISRSNPEALLRFHAARRKKRSGQKPSASCT